MTFLDEARVFVRAGDGGAGCVSFRREKCVPRGGPDGGNGGSGGPVMAAGSRHVSTLRSVHRHRHIRAANGSPGQGHGRTGANGPPTWLSLPLGTQIFAADGTTLLGQLDHEGQNLCLARGGRGGRGNRSFAAPTRRAPRYATKGDPGEQTHLLLRLKLLADAGLVGLPNAGKSTLLRRVSAARPRIGDYPFTTTRPSLGVVDWEVGEEFVLADVPGLVAGAHKGIGLGLRFLGHLERCEVLVHLIAGTNPQQAVENWRTVREELTAYGQDMENKQEILVVSHADTLPEPTRPPLGEALQQATGQTPVYLSSLSGEGVKKVCAAIAQALKEKPHLGSWHP